MRRLVFHQSRARPEAANGRNKDWIQIQLVVQERMDFRLGAWAGYVEQMVEPSSIELGR